MKTPNQTLRATLNIVGQGAGSRDQEVTTPIVLRFRGARALSDFRLAKLVQELKNAQPAVRGVAAEFWHFVEADARARRAGAARCWSGCCATARRPRAARRAASLFLVVPRLGTISPWSSKATDIARNCGLARVRRIERGILFFVYSKEKLDRDADRRAAARPHDRKRARDRSTRRTACSGTSRRARSRSVPLAELEEANVRLGLALNDEEIDYLRDAYRAHRRATRPTPN